MPVELRHGPVRVSVPASSANLGPAFDCAGLALGIEDDLVAMISEDPGVLIEVMGEGSSDVPLDETHLVARAMALGFAAMHAKPPGFVLRCTNLIPHGRGLGSSAAAIIGGLALARALVVDGDMLLPDSMLIQAARSMESHPDNISAALHGGLNFAWVDEVGLTGSVKYALHPKIELVLAIPSSALLTVQAREVLPAEVPFRDASFNVARSALLLHALTSDPTLLLEATKDRLHQQARRPMYSASLELVEKLRSQGIPAVISGAGPSVLVMADSVDSTTVATCAGDEWEVREVEVCADGVRELPIVE